MDFRRREDEHHMSRRLFQCLEKRVKRRIGQHVDFIDNVHAIVPPEWPEPHILTPVATLDANERLSISRFDSAKRNQRRILGLDDQDVARCGKIGNDPIVTIEDCTGKPGPCASK